MGKLMHQVRTQWGPAAVEVLSCDHCGSEAMVEYAVNWLQLFRLEQKDSPKLMGQLPSESHFCGRRCLADWLGAGQ